VGERDVDARDSYGPENDCLKLSWTGFFLCLWECIRGFHSLLSAKNVVLLRAKNNINCPF
jgi:hypothetical protein